MVQKDGIEVFTTYVRNLIAERAREEYSALVESTGDCDQCRWLGQVLCLLPV